MKVVQWVLADKVSCSIASIALSFLPTLNVGNDIVVAVEFIQLFVLWHILKPLYKVKQQY